MISEGQVTSELQSGVRPPLGSKFPLMGELVVVVKAQTSLGTPTCSENVKPAVGPQLKTRTNILSRGVEGKQVCGANPALTGA